MIFWEFCTIIKSNNAEGWSDLSLGLGNEKDEGNEKWEMGDGGI